MPKDEVDRLVLMQRDHGMDVVHVEICKFYGRKEGCRYEKDCSQWHAELGAQARAGDDEWDRT